MRRWKNLGRVWMVAVFGFLYVPIAVLIAFSFNESKSRNVWAGFSLRWYKNLLGDEMILQALGVSLVVAFASAYYCHGAGHAGGHRGEQHEPPRGAVVLNLSYVPIVNPEIVTGVRHHAAVRGAERRQSARHLRPFWGRRCAWALALARCLLRMSRSACRMCCSTSAPSCARWTCACTTPRWTLDATRARRFFKVVLPEIMPAIISAFLISLTYSIDDFIISYFTSGTMQTLPIAIYSMTKKSVSPEINALSTIMFVVILAIILAVNAVESAKRACARPRAQKEGRRMKSIA